MCIYIYICICLCWVLTISGDPHQETPVRILLRCDTVSFHNFKSQNSKLSVSNPKSKYVAYLSVLSQLSNCQGLGRKNKHEIVKTDRMWLNSGTIVSPPSRDYDYPAWVHSQCNINHISICTHIHVYGQSVSKDLTQAES